MLALASIAHAGTPAHPTTISYLALGDSYTIGEGLQPSERWPMQLAHALRSGRMDDAHVDKPAATAPSVALDDPRIIATTGWTTDELSSAIDAAQPLGTYGFVSLAIGVNNQYRGRGVDEYAEQFVVLLDRAIGFAGGRADRVIVLSIPDWGATRFGAESGRDVAKIAHEIDAFNAVARERCAARGVAFVDVAPVSRAHGGEARMLAGDGLHPSAAMYGEWTRLALPVARKLLSQP
ncbi:MAG: SGNH/GDSL hydrolase family protein [Luteimonas sp.]